MASWPEIKAGIFGGESGGDYDALYGFSNRPGGKFAGTKLTGMTVDQAIEFANPRGPYAAWVRGQVGRTATPMGAFQIVGDTLQQAKKWAGLHGDELMDEATQDLLGQAILKNQGTGAWEGYRGPRKPAEEDTASGSYDPRRDTPSPGRPTGEAVSQYALKHPVGPEGDDVTYSPSSIEGNPYALPAGAGTEASPLITAEKEKTWNEKLGEGIAGGLGKITGKFDYQVPNPVAGGLARSTPTPMIDPNQSQNQRMALAYALQRLNAGKIA